MNYEPRTKKRKKKVAEDTDYPRLHLDNYQEITGKLTDITKNELDFIASINFRRQVYLPTDEAFISELQRLIGKRISIFNLDGNYHVQRREVSYD